jgi:hypothetical protein
MRKHSRKKIWRLSAMLVPLAVVACVSFSGAAKTKDPPWVAKDWTVWNADDCDAVLNKSPWGQMVSGGGSSTKYASTSIVAEVQFRSALPVREALLRQTQLKEFYNRMKPDKKQAFDQAHIHDLDPTDQILIYFANNTFEFESTPPGRLSSPGSTAPQATQAALKLSDGTLVQPIESTVLKSYGGYGNETQYTFPRTVGGRPLISSTESILTIELGANLVIYNKDTKKYEYRQGGFQDSGTGYTFKIADMMYRGKLEY